MVETRCTWCDIVLTAEDYATLVYGYCAACGGLCHIDTGPLCSYIGEELVSGVTYHSYVPPVQARWSRGQLPAVKNSDCYVCFACAYSEL